MKIKIIGLTENARKRTNADLSSRWAYEVYDSEFEGCNDVVLCDAVIFKAYTTSDNSEGSLVLDLGGHKSWILRSEFVEVIIL